MFKAQFAPLVKSGAKRQTIRPVPKRMPCVGNVESWRMWSGKAYHSKQTELAQVKLMEVLPVFVGLERIILNHIQLTPAAANDLARGDGFTDFNDLRGWFNNQHGLPFKGILIKAETLTSK